MTNDAYCAFLIAQAKEGEEIEIVERDDGMIDAHERSGTISRNMTIGSIKKRKRSDAPWEGYVCTCRRKATR